MWTFLCLEQVERTTRTGKLRGELLLLSRKIIYVFGDKTLIFLFSSSPRRQLRTVNFLNFFFLFYFEFSHLMYRLHADIFEISLVGGCP